MVCFLKRGLEDCKCFDIVNILKAFSKKKLDILFSLLPNHNNFSTRFPVTFKFAKFLLLINTIFLVI